MLEMAWCSGMWLSVVPYYINEVGLPISDAAALLLVQQIAVAIAGPSWGLVADRWGSDKTLVVASGGCGFFLTLSGFCTARFPLFLLCRACAGCFSKQAAANGYIFENVPEDFHEFAISVRLCCNTIALAVDHFRV